MKPLLAAIYIISLACGYIIGKSSSSSIEESQSASSAEADYERSNARETRTRSNGDKALLDSILGGRSISEIPAAELAAIYIKLSKSDPNADRFNRAKQSYQLQLLLAKLSAKDLNNIATELSSDPETKNSYEFTMIISLLAGKDPALAMDWISIQEDRSKFYRFAIGTIAKNDPLTASSLLSSALTDGKIDEIDHSIAVHDIARSIANLGADSFFIYLDSLPKDSQTSLIDGLMPNIPKNDHIKYIEQVHQRIQDGRLSELDMNDVFSEAITTNNTAATEWLKKLPENEQKNDFRTKAARSLFVNGDKEAAARWMKEAIAAAPGKEKEIIQNAIQTLKSNNPEGIPFFANLLPEGKYLSAEDIYYSKNYGCEKLTALATALSDPNEKSIFIANSLNNISQPDNSGAPLINSNDLDIVARRVADMGFTGQNATRVNDAIEAAKKQLSLKN